MKFKCGLSKEQLHSARAWAWAKGKLAHTEENWHDHFAWWPVKVGIGDCRWLETVERRRKIWTGLSASDELGGIDTQFREKSERSHDE